MKIFLVLVIGWVSLVACHDKRPVNSLQSSTGDSATMPVKRFGMVTGIKPGMISYYKQLHAAVWPGVLQKIKECHISNYSIYIQQIDSNYYLFSYFEYTGADFDQDMKKMADDSLTQRWWKETDPAQLPLQKAKANNQVWTTMEEVFHFH